MNKIFHTRSLRLASLLDAMGFEYAKPYIHGVRPSIKERATFTFYFKECRADGLSAFEVLQAVKNDLDIPDKGNPIDEETLAVNMREVNDRLIKLMRELEESGDNIKIRIDGSRGTALIPQNSSPEERKKYAEII
jgi:superfamily I DNA and/or RNA helicase